MSNLAVKRHRREVFQTTGTVLGAGGSGYRVESDEGDLEARRAHSCLTEPAPGDLVLVAVLPDGAAYVLAVLDREAGAKTRIVTDGDLAIQVGSGRLSITAEGGVAVTSARDVSVAAGEAHVRAVDGTAAFDRASFFGTMVQAEMGSAKVIAGALDTFFDRVSQKVKRSYRFIEEFEHLRAGRLDYVARKLVNLRGENTVVSAEGLVKVDGEQIHVG